MKLLTNLLLRSTSLASLLFILSCSSAPTVSDQERALSSDTDEARELKADIWRDRALALYTKGDYARATAFFETAKLMDPNQEDTRNQFLLFYCYLALGDWNNASEIAQEIVRQLPYHPLSYQQVGLVELWRGNPGKAIDYFARAREFDAHSPRIDFYIGIAQARVSGTAKRDQHFAKAQSLYEQILSTNPTDFSANYEFASLLLYWNKQLEKVPRLLRTAKENIEAESEEAARIYASFHLPLLEGILLNRKELPKESQTVLTRALANAPSGSRPDLAEILHYIGKNQIALGNRDSGLQFLSRSLTLDPNGPYAKETGAAVRTLASTKDDDE